MCMLEGEAVDSTEKLGCWRERWSGVLQAGMAEKGRPDFEKTNLRNFTDPAGDPVEKTNDEVDDVASEVGETKAAVL